MVNIEQKTPVWKIAEATHTHLDNLSGCVQVAEEFKVMWEEPTQQLCKILDDHLTV